MTTHFERQALLAELDTLERSMTALLDALESPTSTAESIAWAVTSYAEIRFEPETLVVAFRTSPADEITRARARLTRLADLEALLRDECARALTRTSTAIEQARVVKVQLDAIAPSEESGTTFDCVR